MKVSESKEYIQIGYTALRDPATGGFLPSVPLYIRADDRARASEQHMIEDIGNLLAQKMKAYMEGCREAGAGI